MQISGATRQVAGIARGPMKLFGPVGIQGPNSQLLLPGRKSVKFADGKSKPVGRPKLSPFGKLAIPPPAEPPPELLPEPELPPEPPQPPVKIQGGKNIGIFMPLHRPPRPPSPQRPPKPPPKPPPKVKPSHQTQSVPVYRPNGSVRLAGVFRT